MIKSKPTTNGSARKGRLKVAIYSLGGLLFAAWIAEGLFSSTELVSDVQASWRRTNRRDMWFGGRGIWIRPVGGEVAVAISHQQTGWHVALYGHLRALVLCNR